jgi:hypothetical protein
MTMPYRTIDCTASAPSAMCSGNTNYATAKTRRNRKRSAILVAALALVPAAYLAIPYGMQLQEDRQDRLEKQAWAEGMESLQWDAHELRHHRGDR